jgi:hypothetical protein
MKDITIDIFIKCLIEDFHKYQEEWLASHNDIEFCPEEEALIVGFLNDTANCYINEHIS